MELNSLTDGLAKKRPTKNLVEYLCHMMIDIFCYYNRKGVQCPSIGPDLLAYVDQAIYLHGMNFQLIKWLSYFT